MDWKNPLEVDTKQIYNHPAKVFKRISWICAAVDSISAFLTDPVQQKLIVVDFGQRICDCSTKVVPNARGERKGLAPAIKARPAIKNKI
jgi:hypothetical protein